MWRAAAAPHLDLREGITEVTRLRYAAALQRYELWAQGADLPSSEKLAEAQPRLLNATLIACLQDMASRASPVGHGTELLASFMHTFPWTRGTLTEAWKAQRVWEKAIPSFGRTPLDADVLDAIVLLALHWGWPLTATALAVGMAAYLRPQELALLRGAAGRILRRPGTQPVLVLTLVRPKTRFRAARWQAVTVRDRAAVRLAELHFVPLGDEHHLLVGGTAGLGKRMVLLLTALGVPPGIFTPGSLRPGGVVRDFTAGRSNLMEVMFHGGGSRSGA